MLLRHEEFMDIRRKNDTMGDMRDETKAAVVAALIGGATLDQASRDNCVTPQVVYWAMKVDPVFDRDVQQARSYAVHQMVDRLETLGDDARDLVYVGIAKLKSENIKWVASKRAASVYGDRIDVNVNQTLDLTAVLLAAEARTIPIIEAKRLIQSTHDETKLDENDARDGRDE